MKARNYECHQGCPVEATLDLIGGRWKGVILFNLIGGPVRFNELRRRMPDVSQRVMTRQLRELEAADIVSRTLTPTVPPRVDYALTEHGATLAPVIQAMRDWGHVYLDAKKAAGAQPVAPAKAERFAEAARAR